VVKAITGIDEQTWTPIRYPNALFDEDEQRWISDAEVAETVLTAFTGRRKRDHLTARLIVRRVRRLNPPTAPARKAGKQGELFAVYHYHAVFTDSPKPMLTAEARHRDHAIVEQVIAELKNGPLAHLPSAGSPRTPPGWSALPWRTTSPAPRARSPEADTAAPAPARSAHTWSRLPRALPTRAPADPAPAPRLALPART